jgi:hypothetical protein
MRSVTVEASEAVAEPPSPGPEKEGPSRPRLEARVASALLALLPGAVVIYFSFTSGGFFPSSVGFVTLLLIQMIVLRVLVTERPFAGYTRRFGITACVFAGYAGWTLASRFWSHAEGRALVEFDRALLYLTLFVLFGLLPRPQWRMPLIVRGLAAAIAFVCTSALITRVLPNVWPTDPTFADNRLSFPLTYWNSLGILAAIGIVLLVGIVANPAEQRLVRAGAAAFVPVTATTLLFTFSRGAILAAIIGVVVYLLASRSTALVGAAIAVGPPTAIAVLAGYDANLLATLDPTQPGAIPQGETVAVTVLACAVAAAILRLITLRVDHGLAASARERTPWSRERRFGAAAGVAAVILALFVAAGGPGFVEREYQSFKSPPTQDADLRNRLTDVSSNGRTDHWRAAFEGFSKAVFKGNGAGTYQFTWNHDRRTEVTVVDAHGLYFEVLSELGIVGFSLLVITIVAILFSIFTRIQGPNRLTYAALFAAGVAWAFHAGIDWDWEMPVVTAWFFAVGGAAVAGRATNRRSVPMGDRGRIPIAAALLVVAVTPTLLMLSQYRLQSAANAFESGEWAQAGDDAKDSIALIANRPEPYQILGYADLSSGSVNEAIAAMHKAVSYEPTNWEYRYSLAIAQAYAGINPLPQLAEAARLNPREPLVKEAVVAFQGKEIPGWLAAARKLDAEIRVSNRLTLR